VTIAAPRQDDSGRVGRGDLTTRWLDWWRSRGGATQGVVPGAYAWAVTVAPLGFAHGSSLVAECAAGVALATLALGPLLERRSSDFARLAVGWGFVLSAVATWIAAPDAAVGSFDAVRGVAGMFGWGLFAFVIASPARRSSDAAVTTTPLVARTSRRLPHTPLLVLGVALAAAVQIPGWHAEPRERALLVRLVALAAGLGLISVASAIATGRSKAPEDEPPRQMSHLPPGLVAWIAASCLLLGAGLAFSMWNRP